MFKRLLKNFNETERSWIMYDVANSAYTLTFVTVFFPIMFKQVALESGVESASATVILLKATFWYALIVAILSPLLGNLADYKGHKKLFFKLFLFTGLIFGVLLSLPMIPWQVYLGIYIIATVGYSGANIFYDSFLTDVTDDEHYDVVSANGFAWGYIGSTIPFILGLLVFAAQKFGVIDMQAKYAIAIAFFISIIWWGFYSLPIIKNVDQRHYIEKPKKWFIIGFINVFKTIVSLFKDPKVLVFLFGYFLYIDAVGTIIKSAVNIGHELGVTDDITLVIIVLLVQFIAFPCALIFGKLAKKIGDVTMLSVGIIIYIIICTFGFFIDSRTDLMIFAGLVGTAQGGVQAVSRSYFGKLIPKERSGDYFGFFNIFGKFAAILGPIIMAYTIDYYSFNRGMDSSESVKYGILALVPLLVIGLILLLISSKIKSRKENLKDLDLL
ncbi:Membrane protein putative [Haloplasma contractile SSD-17B]|uniref:Membrane protein putative n=2 Tax=Haloplasma TaxID=471824 RepID=U2DVN3_9MOLU|nr:Membrane protein putative [Haloplasma contractile SSD-17B]